MASRKKPTEKVQGRINKVFSESKSNKKAVDMAKKATKSKSVSVSIIGSNKSQERKWEVDSALSTLKRAEEIRRDSKLMADVKKAATDMQNIVNNATKK